MKELEINGLLDITIKMAERFGVSAVDLLDTLREQIKASILAGGSQLADFDHFTREIKAPTEIAVAISTGRSELVKLAARDMTKAEVEQLLDVMVVLVDTNRELRRHSALVAEKARHLNDHFNAAYAAADKLKAFANFQKEPDNDT